MYKRLPTGIIYCLTNKVNGKRYIGQTMWPLPKRLHEHKRAALQGPCTSAFHRAIKKYGFDAFDVSVLANDVPDNELNQKERGFIRDLNSRTMGQGYNMSEGGDGPAGVISSKETCRKISDSKRGKNCGSDNPRWGVPHTPEAREKIRMAQTRKETPESRLINSRRQTGEKNSFFGKKHSAAAREKMSESKRGKPAKNKGIKRSPELIAKIVEAKRRNREARLALAR